MDPPDGDEERRCTGLAVGEAELSERGARGDAPVAPGGRHPGRDGGGVDELLVVREKIDGAFALGAVTGEHGFLRWVRKSVP